MESIAKMPNSTDRNTFNNSGRSPNATNVGQRNDNNRRNKCCLQLKQHLFLLLLSFLCPTLVAFGERPLLLKVFLSVELGILAIDSIVICKTKRFSGYIYICQYWHVIITNL